MKELKCEECGEEFTAISKYEMRPDDRNCAVEQKQCETVDGQYIEWWQTLCPNCEAVVEEYGR